MNFRTALVVPCLAGALAVGCSSGTPRNATPTVGPLPQERTDAPGTITLRGQLGYRPRIALPPDSTAFVELRDTASAERPVVGQQRIELRGRQVPVPFEISVEGATDHSYELRGGVLVAGDLVWVLEPMIIAPGAIYAGADVINLGLLNMSAAAAAADPTGRGAAMAPPPALERAPGQQAQVGDGASGNTGLAALLSGPEWVVDRIDGAPVLEKTRVTLDFGDAGRLSGRASCNAYVGEYSVSGDTVAVSRAATTMMACDPGPTAQERAFLDALAEVQRAVVDADGSLTLSSPDGRERIHAKRD